METDHGNIPYEVTIVERDMSQDSSFDRISFNFNDSPNWKSVVNVSGIYISPWKTNHAFEDMERFVKIKQKILNPVTEMSQDLSSFGKMFESMATLNKDCEEPFWEEE